MKAKFTTKTATLQAAMFSDEGTVKSFDIVDNIGSGQMRLIWDEDVYFRPTCGIVEELDALAERFMNQWIRPALLHQMNAEVDAIVYRHTMFNHLYTREDYRPEVEGLSWHLFHGEMKGAFDLL